MDVHQSARIKVQLIKNCGGRLLGRDLGNSDIRRGKQVIKGSARLQSAAEGQMFPLMDFADQTRRPHVETDLVG